MEPDRPKSVTVAGVEVSGPLRRSGPMFRSLRHRDFSLFWGGNFLSNIGTWMQNVALGWLILEMTGSAFLLGVNGFLGSIPSLFFSLPGGAIADRLNRRKLLIYTQTSMMVLALGLAALTHVHLISVRAILLISFLTGLATALNHPAYQSMVPDLVARGDLLNAVALNSAQFTVSRSLGPTLAGLTIGTLGAVGCFYLNSLSFLPLIIALLVINPRWVATGKNSSVWEAVLDGLSYVGRHRLFLLLLSVPAMLALTVLPFIVLMPVIARDMIGLDASGLGYLMGGAGLGGVLAALALAVAREIERKGRVILAGAMAFSLILVVLSRAHNFWGAFGWLVAGGFAMVGTLALTNSTLQILSPPEYRGRIMSMYTLSLMGLAPLGNLLAGAVAQAFGIRAMLAVSGGVGLLYFSILLLFLPQAEADKKDLPAPSADGS